MIFQYDTSFSPKNPKIFSEIFNKGEITIGNYQDKLREELKKITGCKFVFLTSSGTAALHIALLSLELPKNKEIIIPSYLCQEVLNAINYAGHRVRFVDINQSNYSMNIENTKKNITTATGAIIVPYMYGDIVPISNLLDEQVPIIEDIAHCTGGSIDGKRVGSKGIVSMTTFGDRKFLDGGFGGAVFTNNEEISAKIEKLLTPCTNGSYQTNYNYAIPNVIAAIICEKISNLDTQIKRRKEIARYYLENLKETDIKYRYLSTEESFFYRFMIDISNNKREFIKKMASQQVTCGVGVDYPLHKMMGVNDLKLPNTNYASEKSVALPIRPNLEQSEINHIVQAVQKSI